MKRFRWMIAGVAILSLSGCFDLLQEIWVNSDGTARMIVDVALPAGVMHLAGQDPITQLRADAKETEAELKKDPAVTKFVFRDHKEGGQHHLVYELEVNDATKLGELFRRAMAKANSSQGNQNFSSAFEFARTSSGNLRFLQKIGEDADAAADAGEELDKPTEDLGKQLVGAMFAGHYYTVRLHAPGFGETNGVLNDKKDAVEWKIPVADLVDLKEPRELRAELHIAPPIWMWAIVLGVPALLLMLAVGAMKRRRVA